MLVRGSRVLFALPFFLALLLGALSAAQATIQPPDDAPDNALPPALAAGPQIPFVEYDSLIVGGEPKDLVLHPDGRRLFVSDFSGDVISVVDLQTGLVERRLFAPGAPAGMDITPDGRYLFVASYVGGKVFRFDIETGFRAVVPDVQDPWSVKLVTGPEGAPLLAVTEHHGDCVSFIDPVTLGLVESIPTGYYPYEMAEDEASQTLYVIAYGGAAGGRLEAIDLGTLEKKWARSTPRGSFDVEFDAARAEVLVSNYTDRSLSRFSSEGAALQTISLPGHPREIAIGQETIFVSLQGEGQVQAMEPDGDTLYSTSVGSRPSSLIWMGGALPSFPVLAAANEGDGTISLLTTAEPSIRFQDVPTDHPFFREIRALTLRGALEGYDVADGHVFRPDARLLRAQLAKVLVETLSLQGAAPSTVSTQSFDDVPPGSRYPYEYVESAAKLGIVRGVSAQPPRFEPFAPVTRVQLVRMLLRAAESVGAPFGPATGPLPFRDVTPRDPDYQAIYTAYSAGLMSGRPTADGGYVFDGYGTATRGHVSKMVFNMLASLHDAEAHE